MYLRNIKMTVERHPKVDLTLPPIPYYVTGNLLADSPTVDLNIDVSSISSDININDIFSVDSIVSTTTTEALDVKVLRLLELNTVLDLNADTYVSGEDWVDDANGLTFTAFDSPVKTSDGYVRVGYDVGYFQRTCVIPTPGRESDIDAYFKDPYVFYDSSFTIEFAFKYAADVNHLIPAGTSIFEDNFKFFGYTNIFGATTGGGYNFGTGDDIKIVGSYPDGTPITDKKRLPFGLKFSVFAGSSAGNSFDGSTPPHSSLIEHYVDAGVEDNDFDFGIPNNGLQSSYEELKCQIIFDIENSTTSLYVNGELLQADVGDKGIGLSGLNQFFYIGKSSQAGYIGPRAIDIRRLRIYDSALRGAFITESLDSL